MCFYAFNSGHFSELMVECDRLWSLGSRKVTSYSTMGPSLRCGHWEGSEVCRRHRGNEEYRNTPGVLSTVRNAVSNLSGWDELLIEFRFLCKLFKCQKYWEWLLDCESNLSKIYMRWSWTSFMVAKVLTINFANGASRQNLWSKAQERCLKSPKKVTLPQARCGSSGGHLI